MEVVLRQPFRARVDESAVTKIGQRAQATRARKHGVDHLRADAEVRDDQDRQTCRHRFERRGRRHRSKTDGTVHGLRHRPAPEQDRARRQPARRHQVRHQIRVGPPFPVSLLFPRGGAELHHDGSSGDGEVGQREQDLLSLLALRRHLRLRGEHNVLRARRLGSLGGRRVQEGQGGQTELQRRALGPRQSGGDLAVGGDLATAVQQEEIATGAQLDRPAARRDADTRQAGHQDRATGATQDGRAGQGGHHGSRAGQKHHVGLLGANPAQQRGTPQPRHADPSGGLDLGRRRPDRVVDHHLRLAPAGRPACQRRQTPLEVGVRVSDGQHTHRVRLSGRHVAEEASAADRRRGERRVNACEKAARPTRASGGRTQQSVRRRRR